MTACALCGARLVGSRGLCGRHDEDTSAGSWATENRIMCDLLRRGIVRVGLHVSPPGDDVSTSPGA
ncbi:MAG TPA: hypothetical protein VNN07_01000 [Candidatus Tectomicrobia bacterium]|nr:hypothetical protein [Candidatus Tectomicrobia bacterium]